MQIKDIMVREVIAVSEDMPIAEVASLLLQHNIHGVPVIDADRKVLGIITETDFFLKNSAALYLPTYVEMVKQSVGKGIEDIPEMKFLLDASAKDIMTQNCTTLPEVADIQDLLVLVKRHHYETFPIADYRGVLVGIVTLIDVIATLDEGTEK